MSPHHCVLLVSKYPMWFVLPSSPVVGCEYVTQPLNPPFVSGSAKGEGGAVFSTPLASSESSRTSPTRSSVRYVFFASSTATSAKSVRSCSQSHAHSNQEKSSKDGLSSGAAEVRPARLGMVYTTWMNSLTRSKISNRSSCNAWPGPSLQYSLRTLK